MKRGLEILPGYQDDMLPVLSVPGIVIMTMAPAATASSVLREDQLQDPFSVILPTIYVLAGGTFDSSNY